MSNIYKELLNSINIGKQVAIVSKYNRSGSVKTLAYSDEELSGLARAVEGISITDSEDTLAVAEFYEAKPRLIILGGGHIALPLSELGARLGFDITVYDDRPSFANKARFPDAETVICDSFENLSARLKIREVDYIVIVTRGHRHDSLCLREVLRGCHPRYVGMIGSRRRVAIVKEQLEKEIAGVSELKLLHSPIGIPIGAVTPFEIAVSIIGEIISEKRLGSNAIAKQALYPDMELLSSLADGFIDGAILVTIVSTDGSTPREAGAKMVILPHGQTIGSVGGGCAESEIIQKAMDIMQEGVYCLMDIDMTDSAEDDGMVCGGAMKVLIEKIQTAAI